MTKIHYDVMGLICKKFGYPDIFITFTCNPMWPKFTPVVHYNGLHPEDRSYISKVFKVKIIQFSCRHQE